LSALPRLESVTTPALVCDGAVLMENIARMAVRAARTGVELWPHTKTHKSRTIARLQREHGATGLTVATLREAQILAGAGFERLLIAYPPIGEWRLDALIDLNTRVDVRVVLDDIATASMLNEAARRGGHTIRYLWEVDCGVGRCGTSPGTETADRVVSATRQFGHARFDGLMTFGGHAYAASDAAGLITAADDEKDALAQTAAALDELGISVRARSAGTTPTAHQLEEAGPITEIRPGNYVFYDATQVTLGVAGEEHCALSVLGTVVSRPDPRRLILDCGSKALAAERLTLRSTTFGLIAGHPELAVERLYEEHAIITSAETIAIPLGARLRVIPNHSCATANLHTHMLVVEDGEVADIWTIDARGWELPSARTTSMTGAATTA
jgi:D-serine deaminase-like pyridoxal phosphate-dependent protein